MRALPHALCIVAVCTMAASTAHADEPSWRGQVVVGVEVVGAARRTTPARQIGIPIGAPLTRQLLRSTTQRLLRSGQWSNVQFDVVVGSDGARVLVSLVPRLVLLRADIRGNEEFDDSEVRRTLRVDAGSEIQTRDLTELRTRLIAAYAGHGFEQTSAEFTLRETDDPSRKLLVVTIVEGPPTEISEILFEGDAPPRATGLRRAMGVSTGDRLDREDVEGATREGEARLRERGYFESRIRLLGVEASGEGARVRYALHLGPRYAIRVSGHGAISRDEIVEVARLFEERLSQSQLTPMGLRVQDLIQRYGYPDAQVEVLPVRPNEPPPGIDALVLIRIDPKERLEVTHRSFPGARHFDQSFLEEQVSAFLEEAIDLDSPFDPVDTHDVNRLFIDDAHPRDDAEPFDVNPVTTWYEPAYESAAEHVRELYRAAGFLAAEVGPARLERTGDGHAVVRLPVLEGPRAYLHSVSLEGNEALTDREVLEASELGRGQPFSYLALERAKDRITRAYQERGYYYATVEANVRFSGDRTRAEILLQVTERFEVRIRGLRVEGADETSERLIRRVAALDDGELLTPSALRRAQERLLELGIFSGVSATPIEPDLPARTKEISLVLSERKTQYLDFRIGVSTAQGARFGVEYGFRNIRGLALEVSLRAQLGYQFFFLDDTLEQRFDALSLRDRLERRVVLTLAAPYIGIPDVRASLSLGNLRENERNFGLDANTIDLSFAWRPKRSLSFSVGGGVENNQVEVLGAESYDEILQNTTDPRLRTLLRVPEGESTLVAARLSATIDQRDNPFTPTSGFFATGTAEWAKTVRASTVERAGMVETYQSHHLRLLLSASGYLPLGRGVVFATQLRIGRVVHLQQDSLTYPNRKFFLGGVDTIRGYLQDALVPQDIADEICDPSSASCALPEDFNVNAVVQGGDVFMVLRGELRFPIFGSLRGGAFFDLGNSWVDAGELNPVRLRPTAGFGLRISTPVGPIAFDYGFLLARRRFLQEPVGSFHFSIGLF